MQRLNTQQRFHHDADHAAVISREHNDPVTVSKLARFAANSQCVRVCQCGTHEKMVLATKSFQNGASGNVALPGSGLRMRQDTNDPQQQQLLTVRFLVLVCRGLAWLFLDLHRLVSVTVDSHCLLDIFRLGIRGRCSVRLLQDKSQTQSARPRVPQHRRCKKKHKQQVTAPCLASSCQSSCVCWRTRTGFRRLHPA